MATVYLPFGYPLLSGQAFETVVYQGTLARMYDIPSDPRTGSQLFVREMVHDVSKLRATLGTFASGLLRASMGSHWATVVWQMAHGSAEGFWQARLDEWATFDADTKEYLRLEAPFRVTFNDAGMVWWALYGMLYDWAQDQGLGFWHMPEPNSGYVDDMNYWWAIKAEDAGVYNLMVNDGDFFNSEMTYDAGKWSVVTDAAAYGGSYLETHTDGAVVDFAFLGRYCKFRWFSKSVDHQMNLQLDGVAIGGFSENVIPYGESKTIVLGPYRHGVHWLRAQFYNGGDTSRYGNVGWQTVLRLKNGSSQAPQYLTQAEADARYWRLVNHDDHGLLAGLADDDHTQYLTQGRGDARYSLLGHEHYSFHDYFVQGLWQTVPASTTDYLVFGVSGLSTGAYHTGISRAGTMTHLLVRINGTQPASGSMVVTLLVNGVASALVVTIPAGGGAGNYVDSTHTVNIAVNDGVCLKVQNNATGVSAQVLYGSVSMKEVTED